MIKFMIELLWRFNFNPKLSQSQKNDFLETFATLFVEKNNWYCGGAEDMGMYDLDNNTSLEELKSKLIIYLSNYVNIVESITLTEFIESSDSFINKEKILIR